MADYIYSRSTNFPFGITCSVLIGAINSNATINATATCTKIFLHGDAVMITFDVILTAPQITALNAIIAAHAQACKIGLFFSDRLAETLDYGDTSNNALNKFLSNSANFSPSNQSAPLTEGNGEIIYVVVSSNNNNGYHVDIVTGAYDGLPGTYSGGTLIGTVTKPPGVLDYEVNISPGAIVFSKNKRLSCYIRDSGNGGAAKPLIRLFLNYYDES